MTTGDQPRKGGPGDGAGPARPRPEPDDGPAKTRSSTARCSTRPSPEAARVGCGGRGRRGRPPGGGAGGAGRVPPTRCVGCRPSSRTTRSGSQAAGRPVARPPRHWSRSCCRCSTPWTSPRPTSVTRDGRGKALVAASGLLHGILEKEGLERIDPEGEQFDPTAHRGGRAHAGARGSRAHGIRRAPGCPR